MSIMYRPKDEQTTTVEITEDGGKLLLDFYADCGQFGASEKLDSYSLTAKRLLEILQDRDDYTENEW